MDKDFGELVYNSGKHHAGVLILRLEDADGDTKVMVTKKILTEYYVKLNLISAYFKTGDSGSEDRTFGKFRKRI